MNDEELLERLGGAMNVPVPGPSADRIAAVRAAALRAQSAPRSPSDGVRMTTSRRTALLTGAAAAVGAIGGVIATNGVRDDEPTATPGPPTEALDFTDGGGSIDGATIAGEVINHTWGVELLLDTTGFPVGSAYRVVYLDVDGAPIQAGGFVGAELPIHCRCNAALLRDRISAIEILDGADAVVSRAQFA